MLTPVRPGFAGRPAGSGSVPAPATPGAPPTPIGTVSTSEPTAKTPPLNGVAAEARPTNSEPLAPPTTSLTPSVSDAPGDGQPLPISAGTKPPLPARPTEYGTHAPAQLVGEISASCSASADGIAKAPPTGEMTPPSPDSPADQVRSLLPKVSSTSALFSALDQTPSSMRKSRVWFATPTLAKGVMFSVAGSTSSRRGSGPGGAVSGALTVTSRSP